MLKSTTHTCAYITGYCFLHRQHLLKPTVCLHKQAAAMILRQSIFCQLFCSQCQQKHPSWSLQSSNHVSRLHQFWLYDTECNACAACELLLKQGCFVCRLQRLLQVMTPAHGRLITHLKGGHTTSTLPPMLLSGTHLPI